MSHPSDTPPPAVAPLGYAPPPPAHRRRMYRLAALLLVLALVGWSARWWGPPLRERWSLLSAQRKCLRYEPPADTVIFTQDQSDPLGPSRARPRYVIPGVWAAFEPRLGNPGRQTHGVVFLHERTSPGGNRRLVVLDLCVSWIKAGGTNVSIDKAVARPATWRSDPAWLSPKEGAADSAVTHDGAVRHSVLTAASGHAIQLLPGRPDPADRSRFSIDFRVGDQRGTIDGQLHDDDTITLDVRGAPPRRHPSLPVPVPFPTPNVPAPNVPAPNVPATAPQPPEAPRPPPTTLNSPAKTGDSAG